MNITIEQFVELITNKTNITDWLIIGFIKEEQNNLARLNRNIQTFNYIADMCDRGILVEDEHGDYTILQDMCKKVEILSWEQKLYKDIEAKILKAKGKNQFMNPSGKYFKPPELIFYHRLTIFFKKFGDQDRDKLGRALLKYTDEVLSGAVKFPVALIYFIWDEKRGTINSELLSWMEDVDDKEQEDTIIPKDTKDLF